MLNIKQISDSVYDALNKAGIVQIEISARHVHLTQEDVDKLFGVGYKLTHKRDLSQPGQYLCEERVDIITPKGFFKNVAVLGPVRPETQIEISKTDARALGIDAPIKESGYLENTPSITICANANAIQSDGGVIIAKRHIHVTPEIAELLDLRDKDIVCVEAFTDRKMIFDDVVVRVRGDFCFRMHVDFDEGNAANINSNFCLGKIIK